MRLFVHCGPQGPLGMAARVECGVLATKCLQVPACLCWMVTPWNTCEVNCPPTPVRGDLQLPLNFGHLTPCLQCPISVSGFLSWFLHSSSQEQCLDRLSRTYHCRLETCTQKCFSSLFLKAKYPTSEGGQGWSLLRPLPSTYTRSPSPWSPPCPNLLMRSPITLGRGLNSHFSVAVRKAI